LEQLDVCCVVSQLLIASTQTHKKQMKISGRQGNDAETDVSGIRATAAVWLESITERDHLQDWELDGTTKHRWQNM